MLIAGKEGTAYLNARVMKGMNATAKRPISNTSKNGGTMTTTEEITKARSRVTTSTPAR